MQAKEDGLPVVVSMGNVAASGGYWVSTPGDVSFAEPETITGSIGVFGILPSFEGTLAKMGITTDGVRTTPLSGQPDIAGGTTPEFDQIMQLGVEDIYRRFVGLVARARNTTPQQIDAIAHDDARAPDGPQRDAARPLLLVPVVARFGGGARRRLALARHRHADDHAAFDRHLGPLHGPCGRRGEKQQDGMKQVEPLYGTRTLARDG